MGKPVTPLLLFAVLTALSPLHTSATFQPPSISYDSVNRLIAMTNADGVARQWGYTAANEPGTNTIGGATTVWTNQSVFDSAGRCTQLVVEGGTTFGFVYRGKRGHVWIIDSAEKPFGRRGSRPSRREYRPVSEELGGSGATPTVCRRGFSAESNV